MDLHHVFTVPGTPVRVGDVLADEAYVLAGERGREGLVSVEYRVVERTPDRLAYEIRSVEHKRALTGGFESDTFRSVNRSVWDRKACTLKWSYEGQEKRVKVGGVYHLAPAPEGTRVEHVITVEVDIPLIGGRVSKVIAHEFQKTWPASEKRLREALATALVA